MLDKNFVPSMYNSNLGTKSIGTIPTYKTNMENFRRDGGLVWKEKMESLVVTLYIRLGRK